MSGPARGRHKRAKLLRAALACLALIVFDRTLAQAQTLTPDLFRPGRDSFISPQDSPLRRTTDTSNGKSTDPTHPANAAPLRRDPRAPPRVGQVPTYGLPAASGAADTGYDSLNRVRKKPKLYP